MEVPDPKLETPAPQPAPVASRNQKDAPVVLGLAALVGMAFGLWALVRGDVPPPAPQSAPAAPAAQVQQGPTAETLLDLSLAHYQAKRYDDCIAVARQALKLRPGFAEAWNNIAAAYASQSKWDEAIEAAEHAIKINPNYQLAKNNLAWAKSGKAGKK